MQNWITQVNVALTAVNVVVMAISVRNLRTAREFLDQARALCPPHPEDRVA